MSYQKNWYLVLFIFSFVFVVPLAAYFLLGTNTTTENTERTALNTISSVGAYSGDSRFLFSAKRTGASDSVDITALPTQKWSFRCPGLSSRYPAVTADTVYYYCSGISNLSGTGGHGVYALDKTTGAQKWVSPSCGSDQNNSLDVPSSMEVFNNTIFMTYCNKPTAIDATTGAIKWQSTAFGTTGFSMIAPVVADMRVYFTGIASDGNGVVAALNKTTGATIWSKKTGLNTVPYVAVVQGTSDLLFISAGTKLYSWKGGDGSQIWVRTFDGSLYAPSTQYSNVYVANSLGKVFAVNRDTGADIWTSLTGKYFKADSSISTYINIGTNRVVFGSSLGSLYSLDVNTGALKWKVSYGSGLAQATTNSAISTLTNGTIYIANFQGELRAFSNTGAALWTIPLPAGVTSNYLQPYISSGKLFIGSDAGLLRAY